MKRLPLVLAILFLSGCAAAPQKKADVPASVKWMVPGKGKFSDSQAVFAAANQLLSPLGVQADFTVVNKYEYYEKLSLSLSAGQQVDMAWGSDAQLLYLYKINENNFKILDDLLAADGPDIRAGLTPAQTERVKISGRLYYLPVTPPGEGMTPFLKIPKALAEYMEPQKLLETAYASDTLTQAHAGLLTQYLARLAEAGRLGNGADLYSLYSLLPRIGYETVLSTGGLYGYALSDPAGRIVYMQNTPEYTLTRQLFGEWKQSGFTRDDLLLVNKKKPMGENGYVLGGVWAYSDESGPHSVLEEEWDDSFLYIPVDRRLHTARSSAQGAIYIPRNSKYPAEAVKVLNEFYKNPALYMLLTYGIREKHYELSAEGQVSYLQKNPSYAMFTGVFPGYAGGVRDIPAENVLPLETLPAADRLASFYPGITDINKPMYKQISAAAESARLLEPALADAASVENIRAELQAQADKWK